MRPFAESNVAMVRHVAVKLEDLAERLRGLGFREDASEGAPLCRDTFFPTPQARIVSRC